MDERVYDDLRKEDMSDFHSRMLDYIRRKVRLSRGSMKMYYDRWDALDMAYRGERLPDKEDHDARDKGDPKKLAVPLSYAQVQTFVAFCFSLYFQRSMFFEMVGTGPDSQIAAKVAEAVLERDLNYNKWASRLYQFLLDCARFGVAIIKIGWVEEMQVVWRTIQQEISPGFQLGPLNIIKPKFQPNYVAQTETRYKGNRVYNVSPYRFFPDVSLPLSRFQEGEYCASEDEYSLAALKEMERDKLIAGVDHIPAMRENNDVEFDRRRFSQYLWAEQDKAVADQKASIIVTECQIKLIPKRFTVGGEPLGPQEFPIKYNVWYGNDARIIKCEPLGYEHDNFTYTVAQISPDNQRIVNAGIADMCNELQETINWFLNSRITSVRKVISNWLVVDPTGIDIADIKARRPVLKLKPGAARLGVDKWIKQLNVQDVTTQNIQDMSMLQDLMMLVTGINPNALGAFSKGRRSAAEARAVNASTASRLQMIAKIIWTDALEPMGRQMISNSRDGMDLPSFVRLAGDIPNLEAFNRFVEVDKTKLVGNYDFEVFDGTLPSEKDAIAQALVELLTGFIGNPQAAEQLGFDVSTIMFQLCELKGIPTPEFFLLPPARARLAAMGLCSPPSPQDLQNYQNAQMQAQIVAQQMQQPPQQNGQQQPPIVSGPGLPGSATPGGPGPVGNPIGGGAGLTRPDLGQALAGLVGP